MLKYRSISNLYRFFDLIGRSKEQHLFTIEILCNIRNVFIVTFDQLNVSMLNEIII